MSNYIKTTNFAAKDSLPSGNAAKIVKGAEIDTEFNNIATASATKANANNAALTGTTVFATLSDGTIAITGWVDEDNMASNSAVLIPTQQSVKAYVDSNVTAQDLDVTDGTTSIDIDLDSESLGILGGTGITSTASGTGVTLAIDSTVTTLTGTQTLSNKTLTTPVISGALTTNSTIDGRDVAVDGAKLDGIESGATADQTAAEIKTAYESNANTNAFTDADESKLDGIEASADVTDTTNVTAAGALMDSELTNITAVKALNQGVATGDSPTFAAVNAPLTGNVTGNLTGNVTGNVTGDLTGDVTGNVTGNVAGNLTGSVLTAAQTNITSVGTLGALTVAGDVTVDTNTLKVDSTNNRVGILNASPDVTLDIGTATDAVHMPTGTTAQRPIGSAGYFRYNSTLEQFEGYTDAWGAIGGGGGSNLVSNTMTGDGVNTTLTLSNDPLNENNTQVYIDGVYQNKDTYSVSGTTLTFSTAPPNGSAVEAMTIQPTAINIPADASVTSAKLSGDLTTPGALTVTGAVGINIAPTSYKLTVNSGATTETTAAAIGYNGDAGTNLYINTDHGNNLVSLYASGSASKTMRFLSGTLEVMRLGTTGNVGIGTGANAISHQLVSYKTGANSNYVQIASGSTGLGATNGLRLGVSSAGIGEIYSQSASPVMTFNANNVGIGISSMVNPLHVGVTPNTASKTSGSAFDGGALRLDGNLANAGDESAILAGLNDGLSAGIGFMRESGATWGTALKFYTHSPAITTTDELTERMRIDSAGRLLVNTASILSGSEAKLQVLQTVTDEWSTRINNSTASPYGLTIGYASASPNGTANHFHYCTDSSTVRWGVYSNGGVLNYSGNNVNLSDRNAKKDITIHTDNEWDCVKAWEIVDYRYKDEADDSPAKIGVIAQQIQEHCPDLVNVFQEQADAVEEVLGEDGEVVTEAKAAVEERIGVNEAQMMWKVTKALQEAMERIETLEAKVQTLENN